MAYDHQEIEKKAQEKWKALDLYRTDLSDESREPYYLLVEFPYPSGDLHSGHWYAFAVTDIYARLLRLRGKNVLFPIGFDAFGLPAENAAIKHGLDPKEWTYKNIDRMRSQLMSMGASFDWSKEVITCDPTYYQWTQWLFTKLFEHGLAEHREAAVKWCPKDQTVLANEQVTDGRCERCGTEVEEKRLTQWFLKITSYADRLLAGLDTLPWREEIKEAQRAWIGKSEGAKLTFSLKPDSQDRILKEIEVFTTRPDTIFGATYVVLAPEHPLLSDEGFTKPIMNWGAVQDYIAATAKKTERERSENKEKTGVPLEGVRAINPATKEEIPVYVADYVLASYGTGAVMAVPAHDERDFAFANKYGIPLRQVIVPKDVFRAIVVTPTLDDLESFKKELQERSIDFHLAISAISNREHVRIEVGKDKLPVLIETIQKHIQGTNWVEILGSQSLVVTKGEVHSNFLDEADKWFKQFQEWEPLLEGQKNIWDMLGKNDFFKDFICFKEVGILRNSKQFDGKDSEEAKWDIVAAAGGERTTQYRIRDWLISRQRYWGCPIPIVYDPEGKPHVVPAEHLPWLLPTDVDFKPTGCAPLASSKELKERVTRLFGEGWTPEYDTLDTFVDSSWYFLRYLDPKDAHDFSNAALMKKWLPVNRYSGGSEHTTMHLLYARFFMKALYDLALVPVEEPFIERFNRGLIMGPDGTKMSKSKGNVVNPDEFVREYGADAVRLYLAFIGPYNEPGNYPWNLGGVASMRKFLERIARLVEKQATTFGHQEISLSNKLEQALARASLKISEDGDRFKFNTGIAALMILLNELEAADEVPLAALIKLVIMLAPFAPHLAEHLWETLGGEGSVHTQAWPMMSLATVTTREVVVQVNGKRRGTITLAVDASQTEAVKMARTLPTVLTALGGNEPKRVIYIEGKILNLVV